MIGCTTIDKPLITIVLAVYKPRLDWLREQLISLNAQTYENLEILVRDDFSPMELYFDICEIVASCINKFPYKIARNDTNLGSLITFEKLTLDATGEYIAYCDQDDIWLPEKLKTLQTIINNKNAHLVCSDMCVIDGKGVIIADGIRKVRRHHVFYSGEGIGAKLLFSNFVTGCTMLVCAEDAKAAVPFCPYMVHDHWLALFCANRGEVISLPDRLIYYRIHGTNQTQMMAGIVDKQSYLRIRILSTIDRLIWLKNNFCSAPTLTVEIENAIMWLEGRKRNMENHKGLKTILKYRTFSPLISAFEIIAAYLPDKLFMLFIRLEKKNVI